MTYESHKRDDALLEPYNYIDDVKGKDIRGKLIDAFQFWIRAPPAHVAQDRPPPAEAKAPPASAPAPPAAAPTPPADKDTFKAFDPAVLARTVAAYRAPVAAAPDSNEDAWASIKPPEQEEAEEPASNEPITYDEALRYFQGLDMSSDKEKITPTQPDQRHVLKRIFKRRPDLKAPDAERDFVFLVALQKYDPRVPVHWRMIHTVFRELTPKNKPVPCPTLGAHWVRIGFQGNDPRTDVNRAMRCLALLQLLHLLEKERRLAGALFRAANQGGTYQCGSTSRVSYASMAWRWTYRDIRGVDGAERGRWSRRDTHRDKTTLPRRQGLALRVHVHLLHAHGCAKVAVRQAEW